MNSPVWIYFSKTGTGFEMIGSDIISGINSFYGTEGTFVIESSYSDISNDLLFFIYEWDNSQKKLRMVYEAYQKEIVLMGMVKNIDKIPLNIQQKILSMYVNDDEELELEKNANS